MTDKYEQCKSCSNCAGILTDLDGKFIDYVCSGSMGLLYATDSLPDCKHYKPDVILYLKGLKVFTEIVNDEIREAAHDLLDCFPGSIVNAIGEFVADIPANAYFNLKSCKDYEEVKCKVLEAFSRDAFKTEPFKTRHRNAEFHWKMLEGINAFLGTEFTGEDMEKIYTPIGNGVNRELTLRFIRSQYDMRILEVKE